MSSGSSTQQAPPNALSMCLHILPISVSDISLSPATFGQRSWITLLLWNACENHIFVRTNGIMCSHNVLRWSNRLSVCMIKFIRIDVFNRIRQCAKNSLLDHSLWFGWTTHSHTTNLITKEKQREEKYHPTTKQLDVITDGQQHTGQIVQSTTHFLCVTYIKGIINN